jgi:hypothetical protein
VGSSESNDSGFLFPPGGDDVEEDEGDGDEEENYADVGYEDEDGEYNQDEYEEYGGGDNDGGIDYDADYANAQSAEMDPVMPAAFYSGVENLLSRPPPSFSSSLYDKSVDKKNAATIKANKDAVRKMEQMSVGKDVRVSNVTSKLDTGKSKKGKAGGGSGSGSSRNTELNMDMVAQAFQYAERIAASEALDEMEGKAAAAAHDNLENGNGRVFAGNPVNMVRRVREKESGGGGGGRGGQQGGGMVRSNSAPGNNLGKGGAAYGSGGGGKAGGKKKGSGGAPGAQGKKMVKAAMSYGNPKDGSGGDGKKNSQAELQNALASLQDGSEMMRLRAELEESRKRMEGHSDILRSAAGDYLRQGR